MKTARPEDSMRHLLAIAAQGSGDLFHLDGPFTKTARAAQRAGWLKMIPGDKRTFHVEITDAGRVEWVRRRGLPS